MYNSIASRYFGSRPRVSSSIALARSFSGRVPQTSATFWTALGSTWPAFYRANLGLAYAKALSNRRIYEEVVDVLDCVKPEQVVDPASFLFHRAVAEHALMKSREANTSIMRLLDDVSDAPERYKMVAALMVFDMMAWKDKDLGSIARKMDNIERRLDLSRGGPKTQKLQKEVIARLDELIKEKENQQSGCGS